MTDLEIARMAGYSIFRYTSTLIEENEAWAFKGSDGCLVWGYKTKSAAAKAAVEYEFACIDADLSKLCLKLLRNHKLKTKTNVKQNESNRNNTDRSGGKLPPARN